MKIQLTVTIIAALFMAGCASTPEKRKQEKPGAYEKYPTEIKGLIDAGKIQAGMDRDAVYLAWGKPGKIVNNQFGDSMEENWTYFGVTQVPKTYWTYTQQNREYPTVDPRTYWEPLRYVSGEVTFTNGVVKSFLTYPVPKR